MNGILSSIKIPKNIARKDFKYKELPGQLMANLKRKTDFGSDNGKWKIYNLMLKNNSAQVQSFLRFVR